LRITEGRDVVISKLRAKQINRFWSLVDLPKDADRDKCWLWKGALDSRGYPVFNTDTVRGAHLFAYTLMTDKPIPPGMEPHQACDNRACVSFEHLELLTHGQYLKQQYTERVYMPRACIQCSTIYTPTHNKQKYCHNNCKQRAWKETHK